MRINLGLVAYLRAPDSGYGIGLDDEGHRLESVGDRHVLAMAQRTAFIRAASQPE